MIRGLSFVDRPINELATYREQNSFPNYLSDVCAYGSIGQSVRWSATRLPAFLSFFRAFFTSLSQPNPKRPILP